MKTVTFKIKGITPFLYHKFNIEQLSNKSKTKSGSAGNDPEEWKTTVWNEGKRLFIPGFYFFSCICAGAQYVKAGRGSIAKKLAGCLLIKTDKAFLNRELETPIEETETENITKDSSRAIYLDVRGVKNPATKGKNVRYRLALSPGWETDVECEFDDTVISKDDFRRALEASGKFSGIGDARLIGHGRFEVYDIKFI